MRNISFMLTPDQVRTQTKTVTRRIGWKTLKPGTLLQPVVKAQGLKKGEHVEPMGGPIRVISVRREPLSAITDADVRLEGFPNYNAVDFCAMFCEHNAVSLYDVVTRIEFEYVRKGR